MSVEVRTAKQGNIRSINGSKNKRIATYFLVSVAVLAEVYFKLGFHGVVHVNGVQGSEFRMVVFGIFQVTAAADLPIKKVRY